MRIFYLILLSKKHEKYFLKVNENGKYDYPEIKEFIELNKLYNSIPFVFGTKSINIKPMLKIKNNLVCFALASATLFSLSGCKTNVQTIEKLSENGIRLEEGIIKDDNMYFIDGIASDAKSTKYLDISQIKQAPYSKHCTPLEFSKMMGLENISYNDIKDVIRNNQNLKEEEKTILLEAIDNLEKNNFNMDLGVLYYNLSNLEVEYLPTEKIGEIAGYFDHFQHKAFLNSDIFSKNNDKDSFKKITIIHEIIGHGSNRTYNPDNGGVMCDISQNYVNVNEGKVSGSGNFGHSAMEATAELITYYGTNNKMSHKNAGYTVDMYYLQNLCYSNGVSLIDFANNGIDFLVNKMLENGIEDPVYYITVMDTKLRALQHGGIVNNDISLTETITSYYKNVINKMLENGSNYEEINNFIKNTLKRSESGIVVDTSDPALNLIYKTNIKGGSLIVSTNLIEMQLEQYLNEKFTNSKTR